MLASLELGAACFSEKSGRASDEQLRAVVRNRVDERRAESAEERPLVVWQSWILESPPQRRRTEPQADDLLLEVRASPVDKTRVDRLLELEDALGHATG